MAKGITEEDVTTAADELLAKGQRPTIERVRQAMGRGSPNTINRHLDAWWANLSERLAQREGTTSKVPNGVTLLARRLWEEAFAQAKTAISIEMSDSMAKLEQERAAVDQQRAQLRRDSAVMTAAFSVLKDHVRRQTAELAAKNKQIARLEATTGEGKRNRSSVRKR